MSTNTGSEKHGGKIRVSSGHVRSASTGRFVKNTAAKNVSKKVTLTHGGQDFSVINIGGRTASVAQALGSKSQLAILLKVAASQPTRWITGEETPNSENARALIDLDHVIARARLLWSNDEVVKSWLTGSNAFLGGARPVDVITLEGTAPVIDALDQEMAGGYA